MIDAEVLRCGERALLVEFGDSGGVHAAAGRARERWPELEDAVPGHDTLLLVWPGRAPEPAEVRGLLDSVDGVPAPAAAVEVVIPTVYDGEDLAALAAETGLSREAVVALHSGALFTAAFIGFAPGFAYLTGLPRELLVERLEEPRVRVPAGAVAVAGEYSAIYPTASPGGWRLIGRTDSVLFDHQRDRPSLIEPGMRVRFEAVRG